MPQTLLTTPPGAAQALAFNGQPLAAAHAQLVGILRSRLGQNHGDLLAQPRPAPDGGTAWVTGLAGAVQPAAQLPDDARQRLQQRAERVLGDIRGLAQQLQGEGPSAQLVAQMLALAVQTPPGDWLYSVDGKPVLAMWGHAPAGSVVGAPLAAAAPLAATAAPVAGAPAAAPLAAAGGTAASAAGGAAMAAPAARRWWLWALAVLALLALAWALSRCSPGTSTDPALAAQIAQAEARILALDATLAQRKAAPPQQCVPDAPLPAASAPEPPASAPEPRASAPEPAASQPEPRPADLLRNRIAAAGKDCKALAELLRSDPGLKGNGSDASALRRQILDTLAKHCRDQALREAGNLCPGQRPKELAPQMAIVFDASGSMQYSLDLTDAEIRQSGQAAAVEGLMRQFGLGGAGGGGGSLARLTREPTRITAAKRATLSVARRVPSDMSVGLVTVESCPAARSVGMFGPGQRGALIGQIEGISPRQGTPLADGISQAGRLVDGVTRDAVIVVVSDGAESCGQDPCAVAAALKRQKPRLKINVVDITGTGAGNCVAQATGGKVYTANNAAQLQVMTDRAAQDAMGPANCK